MCTFLLQNGAMCDMELVHCEICATGLLSITFREDVGIYIDSQVRALYIYISADSGVAPSNERRRYFVTTSLIGLAPA